MHRRASPNRPRDQWMLHVRIRCTARPGPRQSTMCTDGSSFGSYHNTSTLACRDGTRRFDGNTDAPGTLCHPIPVRQAEHTALYRRAVPTPQYRGVPLCTGVSQTRRVGRVPTWLVRTGISRRRLGTSDDDGDYSVSSSVPPDVPTVRRPCAADVRGLHGVLRDVANGGPLRRGERERIACNSGGI